MKRHVSKEALEKYWRQFSEDGSMQGAKDAEYQLARIAFLTGAASMFSAIAVQLQSFVHDTDHGIVISPAEFGADCVRYAEECREEIAAMTAHQWGPPN